MYVRVLQDELTFPEDKAMDQDTKNLIRGVCLTSTLLQKITIDGDRRAVIAAEPCFKNQRTEDQTASLFLDDVSRFLGRYEGIS